MGTIKDRNGMDLTEAYEIKKIQMNSTKKGLNNPNNHDGVVTIDILECEVEWALGSITMNKTSGGDGIIEDCFRS